MTNLKKKILTTSQMREILLKDIIQNMATCHLSNNVVENTLIYTKKRGKNGGTWMHPYLFIDFAMFLSAEFKLQCIKWLHDNLLILRDETRSRNSF